MKKRKHVQTSYPTKDEKNDKKQKKNAFKKPLKPEKKPVQEATSSTSEEALKKTQEIIKKHYKHLQCKLSNKRISRNSEQKEECIFITLPDKTDKTFTKQDFINMKKLFPSVKLKLLNSNNKQSNLTHYQNHYSVGIYKTEFQKILNLNTNIIHSKNKQKSIETLNK